MKMMKNIFYVETDEERIVPMPPDNSDEERQANSEDSFTGEYSPISYSEEERLEARHGFNQGIRNILVYHYALAQYLYFRDNPR